MVAVTCPASRRPCRLPPEARPSELSIYIYIYICIYVSISLSLYIYIYTCSLNVYLTAHRAPRSRKASSGAREVIFIQNSYY